MKIGLDIDGVLANFCQGYGELCIKATKENKFPDDGWRVNDVPVWNWPEHFGYTTEQVADVWSRIRSSTDFWAFLKPLTTPEQALLIHRLDNPDNELYFITDRPGTAVKTQTEAWLMGHFGIVCPTVLISKHKAQCCNALGIQVYVDDKLENCQQEYNEGCKVYCLDRSYNQGEGNFTRITKLEEAFG